MLPHCPQRCFPFNFLTEGAAFLLLWGYYDSQMTFLTHSPFWTFCSNVSSFMQILQKLPRLPINCKGKQIKT